MPCLCLGRSEMAARRDRPTLQRAPQSPRSPPNPTVNEFTETTLELAQRYVVNESIHRGPMATLYAGKRELFDLDVVVRTHESLIKLRLMHRAQSRIRDEVAKSGYVRGDGLPDTLDVGLVDGTCPFLIYRVPRGELLSERLERGERLKVDDAARLVDQVGDALLQCRRAGTTHRGPTVDRIWVTHRDDRPILMGLGEVLYGDEAFQMATPYTTELVWHLSPEALSSPALSELAATIDEGNARPRTTGRFRTGSAATVDQRALEDSPSAEVYALGCLLFHVLYGHHPFFVHRGNPAEGVNASVHFDPVKTDDDPALARVSAVLDRALHKDPASRFPNVEALQAALRTIYAEESGDDAGARATSSHNRDDSEAHDSHPLDAEFDDDEFAPEHDEGAAAFKERRRDATSQRLVALRSSVWIWRMATLVMIVGLAIYLARLRTEKTVVIVTSDPPGLPLQEIVGHVPQDRGSTPVFLTGRAPDTPITLQVVSPDGVAGEASTFTPADLNAYRTCRALNLEVVFESP